MNRNHITIIVVTFLLASGTAAELFGQGKLGRAREAVRKHDAPDTSASSKREKKDDKKRDERRDRNRNRKRRKKQNRDSGLSLGLGSLFVSSAPAVHVVEHHVAPTVAYVGQPVLNQSVVDEPIIAGDSTVPPLAATPIVVDDSLGTGEWVHWGVRLSAIGGTDFDDIGFGGFGLLLQAPGGPGIDTSVAMLRESGTSFRDHLFLGDVNFVYEPFISSDFRMRLGIGVNWLADSFGGDAGFNMTAGFDWKLGRRWLVTGEVDFGTIGDADLLHTQVSLGRRLNESAEWAFGYDYKDIGGATIGAAFTGLRFRF